MPAKACLPGRIMMSVAVLRCCHWQGADTGVDLNRVAVRLQCMYKGVGCNLLLFTCSVSIQVCIAVFRCSLAVHQHRI